MDYFEQRYRMDRIGKAGRIISMAAAHHRLNYIHLSSTATAASADLMATPWPPSRDRRARPLVYVARLRAGSESRGEYKRMMDHADMPRQGDLDGRGNLSHRAL